MYFKADTYEDYVVEKSYMKSLFS